MASSITLQGGNLFRSHFLGQTNLPNRPNKSTSLIPKESSRFKLKPCAVKFDLFQLLGGRGLCNGEQGIEQELKKRIESPSSLPSSSDSANEENSENTGGSDVPENAFDKELMGLTGGFPGGEKGLQKFIQENPPPKNQSSANLLELSASKKPKPPELPLLMPGMIAIVSNRNSPYYMYCGIVQRITDGKAAVLFEGGNWDRLITFRLDELERREKGPPGKSPRSVIIEELVQKE